MAITYGTLNTKHPSYDQGYWSQIRALVSGGKDLLQNPDLLKTFLPKKPAEEPVAYATRLAMAHYVPLLGEALNKFVSGVFTDRVEVEPRGEDEQNGVDAAPDYYDELEENVSGPGAARKDLNQLLKEQLFNALMLKRAWTLVDLPKMPDDYQPVSLADELEAGALNAYLCKLDPECVYDWEDDDKGNLLWVLVCSKSQKRMGVDTDRSTVTETFTEYNRDGWKRWTFIYDQNKPPKDDDEPSLFEEGRHSFGRVPVVRMELPDILWAGNKAFSVALELFRKQNALSYGIDKGLHQILVAKLAPQKPYSEGPDPIAEDPNRATNQPVGPGRIMTLAAEDVLEYVSPSVDPFKVGQEQVDKLVEELHRCLNQMAHAVSNTGAALNRSAESKSIDFSSFWTVCLALGGYVRDHARDVFETVAQGRGEPQQFVPKGAEDFQVVEVSQLLEEAQSLALLDIPSPTAKAGMAFELVRTMWTGATPDQLERVKAELAAGFSVEEAVAKAQADNPPVETATVDEEQ